MAGKYLGKNIFSLVSKFDLIENFAYDLVEASSILCWYIRHRSNLIMRYPEPL
jgi:hypothetical protein